MEMPDLEIIDDGVVRDSRGRHLRPKSALERLARESLPRN